MCIRDRATTGVLGAVAAFYILEISTWRNAYIIGGILGLVLLIFRMGTFESKMFKNAENSEISRGNLLMLFNSKERFLRFLKVILVGAPIWFLVGILITLAPEFGKVLHSTEPVSYTHLDVYKRQKEKCNRNKQASYKIRSRSSYSCSNIRPELFRCNSCKCCPITSSYSNEKRENIKFFRS